MNNDLNVQQFTDFRAFLIAHAQRKKDQDPKWTFGRWAKSMGLKSTSSITKIIQGDRDAGKDITQRLIRYFRFTPVESSYFSDLIRLHKIQKDPRLAVLLMENIGKEYPNASLRIMDDKSFAIVSTGTAWALREMVRMENFLEDPEWLSSQFLFQVTPRELTQALKNLLQTGLLKRDASGRLEIAEGRLNTSNDISSEAIQRYHEKMSENAKLAVREIPVEDREFSACTFVFSKKNLPQAKEYLRAFKSKFARLFEEESGEAVYHFQLQFFPVTKENNP